MKPNSLNRFCIKQLLAVTGFFAMSVGAHAATITWGAAMNVNSTTNISTIGTPVFARNIGSTTGYVINGVTFTGTTTVVNSTANTGTVDISGAITAGGWGDATYTGYGTGGASGDYGSMLNTGIYEGGDSSVHTQTLSGLTNGQQYLIQVWFTDTRFNGNANTFSDGVNAGVQVQSTTTFSQYAIGTFTAIGTTQTLRWTETGTTSAGATINALQLRAVPEPSAALLGGLGLIALLRRRRA